MGDGLSDKRGGDVEERGVEGVQGSVRWCREARSIKIKREARTREDEDGKAGEEAIIVFPAIEGSPIVSADEESELSSRLCLGEGVKSTEGVRGSREVKLHITDREFGISVDGITYPIKAPSFIKEVVAVLERIKGRDDEAYLIDVTELRQPIGEREMPDVDRVERAGKNSNPAGFTHRILRTCSLICSSSSFIRTTIFCICAWLALEPMVLISRPISWAMKPSLRPCADSCFIVLRK